MHVLLRTCVHVCAVFVRVRACVCMCVSVRTSEGYY